MRLLLSICFCMLATATISSAAADDLFHPEQAAIAADRRAAREGDILTVVVYQAAEARNAAANSSHTRRTFEGGLSAGEHEEDASLRWDGAYSGQGEVRRSESFVTQISVRVREVLRNGDLQIAGEQSMLINGERTMVRVRGRVRPADITSDNQVLSSRIADAEISYDGRGFVTRNARPNFVQRLLGFLGLGG